MRFKTAILAALLAGAASAAPVFTGPAPYLSSADSPFSGVSFSWHYLETFESGALSLPGVSVSPGTAVLGTSPLTDSVDADDGAIDGLGQGGHSLYNGTNSIIRFTFNSAALGGNLPTHAGIVWTDLGFSSQQTGFGNVSFRAFDALNNQTGSIGPFTLGDGSTGGGTAEDRFFGVSDSDGIAAFEISVNSQDWEVDHLQFGYAAAAAIPEPATFAMLACGLGSLAVLRRRRS